jgi:hypothetical protein
LRRRGPHDRGELLVESDQFENAHHPLRPANEHELRAMLQRVLARLQAQADSGRVDERQSAEIEDESATAREREREEPLIDLAELEGKGSDGRVTVKDVRQAREG